MNIKVKKIIIPEYMEAPIYAGVTVVRYIFTWTVNY